MRGYFGLIGSDKVQKVSFYRKTSKEENDTSISEELFCSLIEGITTYFCDVQKGIFKSQVVENTYNTTLQRL